MSQLRAVLPRDRLSAITDEIGDSEASAFTFAHQHGQLGNWGTWGALGDRLVPSPMSPIGSTYHDKIHDR